MEESIWDQFKFQIGDVVRSKYDHKHSGVGVIVARMIEQLGDGTVNRMYSITVLSKTQATIANIDVLETAIEVCPGK